jgi:hypothetical protein
MQGETNTKFTLRYVLTIRANIEFARLHLKLLYKYKIYLRFG